MSDPKNTTALTTVTGRGGGSGKGGSSGGGVIAQNTLQSNTVAQIIEMLGEGPIVGLVSGAQSIFFNETPLQNADGSYNFGGLFIFNSDTGQYNPVVNGTVLTGDDQWVSGVSYATTTGLPDQDVIPGYASSSTTTEVNQQIQNSIGPIVRTIEDATTTSVLVTIGIPNLSTLDPSTGNLNAASVSWTIDVAPSGGAYVNQVNINIYNQKCTSLYLHQSLVTLPSGGAPWNIRVTRTTADALTDVNVQNQTWWESYSEIVQGQFMYPDTALVALTVNSEFFGSTIPTRGYLVQGLKTDIPSNYDPVARTYTGVWDGTFVTAWHNNPVWVLYALLTNDRWGIGEFIDEATVDKWGLYAISQYCDELIPSGFTDTNGDPILEPRYTYNGVINNRQEAFKTLRDVCSAFRGMGYWSLGQFFASADMPQDPITTVSPANVEGGAFNYSGTALKARHSVAAVTWNDPNDFYRPAIELVQSDTMIQTFGWRQADVSAPGCTSRGQALRYGKWLLDTEEHETETVEFTLSWDSYILQGGMTLKPGHVIYVADPRKTGNVRIGGRIAAVGSTSSVTIDAPFVPTNDDSYTLTVAQPDGTIETQPIGSFDETNTVITLSTPLAQTPQVGAMWVIQGTDVNPRQYRVLSVQEQDAHLFKVTALFFDPTKFERVEDNIALPPATYVRPNNVMQPPQSPSVVESNYFLNGAPQSRVTLSWTQPSSSIATTYNITANGPLGFVNFGSTNLTSIDLLNVTPGDWTFYIAAVSVSGVISINLPYVYTVTGWSAVTVPTAVSLALLGGGTTFTGSAPTIVWANTFPSGTPTYALNNIVRVYNADTNALLRTETVAGLSYTYSLDDNTNDGAGTPIRDITFTVTAMSLLGVEQETPATITVSNPQPTYITPTVSVSGTTVAVSWSISDNDYQGSEVWLSSTSGFDPTVTEPIYNGPDTSYTGVVATPGTYYVRVGAYDDFGTTGMLVGPEVSFYVAGVDLTSLGNELQAYIAEQATLTSSIQQTQGVIAVAASEQDAANWLDKYNTKSIVNTQITALGSSISDDVASLLATVASDVATLNTSITNAQSDAVSISNTYTNSSIAAYNTSVEATYATQTGVTSAIATGVAAAESTAASALSAYETTVSTNYTTTTGMNSAIATAQSAAESFATGAVTTLSNTLTSNYTTTTGMNSAIATAQTTAENFATAAVSTLSTTLTTNYTTTSGMNTAINAAQSTAETYATNAVATLSTTLTTNYTTTSGMNSAIATAQTTAENFATAAVTTLSNTLTTNYTTTSGMNTAINAAQATAESFATGAITSNNSSLSASSGGTTATVTISIASPGVVTWSAHGFLVGQQVSFSTTGSLPVGLTTNTWYTVISAGLTTNTFEVSATAGGSAINTSGTQSGTHTGVALGMATNASMSSAISAAITTADGFATSAIASLNTTLTATINTISASGQFQVVASAGVNGALSQIDFQTNASYGAAFADAGIQLAAFVDSSNNPFSRIRLYSDQLQIGSPDYTGGGYVSPFAIQNVNGGLQMSVSPGVIPDNAILPRMISSGTISSYNIYTSGNVGKTYTAWNNSGNGDIVLSQTVNVSAGSALKINFSTGIVASGEIEPCTYKLTMTVNGTVVRTFDFTTVGDVDDFQPDLAGIFPMDYLVAGLSAGPITVAVYLYVTATSTAYTITAVTPQFILEEIKNAQVTSGVATPPTPSVSYQTSIVGGTSSSFLATAIGTANGNRVVVVGIGYYSNSTATPTMTIGGSAATLVSHNYNIDSGTYNIAMFQLRVPSGTTADIIASLPGTSTDIVISVWSVIAATAAATGVGNGYATTRPTPGGFYSYSNIAYCSVTPIISTQVMIIMGFGVNTGVYAANWNGSSSEVPALRTGGATSGPNNCRFGAWDMSIGTVSGGTTVGVYSSSNLELQTIAAVWM